MSKIYDNWERLVAAVLKRDEIWQICHAPSRSTSFSSTSSSFNPSSTSQFDENSKSSDRELSDIQFEDDWVEQYEPGVYITIAALSDGTRLVKRVLFSHSRCKLHEAESWWRDNRKKVNDKYYAQGLIDHVKQSSISNQTASIKTMKESGDKINNNLTEFSVDNKLKSTNLEVQVTASEIELDWTEPAMYITIGNGTLSDGNSTSSQFDENFKYGIQIEDELVEQYEPGVYISLRDSKDGCKEVRHIRFSRRLFGEIEAEKWWLENREKVYHKYNAQPEHTSESSQLKNPVVERTVSQNVNEWVENYEPGVHVTLRAVKDGTRNVVRLHFSERFKEDQADDWWLKNRKKVCEKYNARAGLARINHHVP